MVHYKKLKICSYTRFNKDSFFFFFFLSSNIVQTKTTPIKAKIIKKRKEYELKFRRKLFIY